jgi:hypothetical protein
VGVVTEYLIQLLAKQAEDRGLAVWYDPEHAYPETSAPDFPSTFCEE